MLIRTVPSARNDNSGSLIKTEMAFKNKHDLVSYLSLDAKFDYDFSSIA